MRPPEDRELTAFLQKHRPLAPPPGGHLEQSLVASIEADLADRALSTNLGCARSGEPRSPWRVWGIPTLVAATAAIAWTGGQVELTRRRQAVELAQLQQFLEDSWGGTMTGEPTFQWIPQLDSFVARTADLLTLHQAVVPEVTPDMEPVLAQKSTS